MMMSRAISCLFGTTLLAVGILAAGPACSEAMWMPTATGPFSVRVRSMHELRFVETVRQGYDFSCGSAAIATLLTFHYERPTTELQVFEKMWNQGNKEKIREHGFSMLDMKHYLETEGMAADGFKIPASRMAKIGVAGLILLDKLETPHFVVVIGESNGELLVSDPARGIWNISIEEVEQLWNGVFFVVRERVRVAKGNFNDAVVWKSRRWAPLGEAEMAQLLVPMLKELPLPSEFNVN